MHAYATHRVRYILFGEDFLQPIAAGADRFWSILAECEVVVVGTDGLSSAVSVGGGRVCISNNQARAEFGLLSVFAIQTHLVPRSV